MSGKSPRLRVVCALHAETIEGKRALKVWFLSRDFVSCRTGAVRRTVGRSSLTKKWTSTGSTYLI